MTTVGTVAHDLQRPRREGVLSVWSTNAATHRPTEDNYFLTQSDHDVSAGVVWVQRGMDGEAFSLPIADLWRLFVTGSVST